MASRGGPPPRRGGAPTVARPPSRGGRGPASPRPPGGGGGGGGGGAPPRRRGPGGREPWVARGGTRVRVVAGPRHELNEGDSVTFDADLPHHFENEGEEP